MSVSSAGVLAPLLPRTATGYQCVSVSVSSHTSLSLPLPLLLPLPLPPPLAASAEGLFFAIACLTAYGFASKNEAYETVKTEEDGADEAGGGAVGEGEVPASSSPSYQSGQSPPEGTEEWTAEEIEDEL
jgi:hypothetical protein